MSRRGLLEAAVVTATGAIVAVATTYPLAFEAGRVGRIDSGDGQWSIWVVAWVARTLVVDPLHVFDANIFYPHRGTLAYSETNLVTGALAAPVYWATRNPYLAHNVVLLLALVLAAAGGYYLARYLTRSRAAAAVGAALFAFCPYVFAHTAHIHLFVTAGLPFSLLAFHRLVDRPTAARAAALGVALALTGLTCGYYGIYAGLAVAGASVYYLVARRLWKHWPYYRSLSIVALVTLACLAPFVKQYLDLGEGNRPSRTLADAALYAANWSAYLASAGLAHRWMLKHLGQWSDVVFPGFCALALSAAGAWAGLNAWRGRSEVPRAPQGDTGPPPRARTGESIGFYGLLTLAAFWLSFGPKAGLYSVVYWTIPFFSLLRAPVRLGVVVSLGLAMLAAFGLARLLQGRRRPALWASLAAALALVEATPAPMRFRAVPPASAVYDTLALLPAGPVVEMPFFWQRRHFDRHTYYMRLSTRHWKPLVNGYSDYFPPDFREIAEPVHLFPSQAAFDTLRSYAPRYVVFHLDLYDPAGRALLLARIAQFGDDLRPLASDTNTLLYEIIGWPAGPPTGLPNPQPAGLPARAGAASLDR